MNITSINGIKPSAMPTQPVNAETMNTEFRQAKTAERSNAASAITEQSVAQTQKTEASRRDLEDAIQATNDFLKPINNSIKFTLDDDTGRTVVKVVDQITQEIVRQIPSEEMLVIAKAIDKMKGLLVQQKA